MKQICKALQMNVAGWAVILSFAVSSSNPLPCTAGGLAPPTEDVPVLTSPDTTTIGNLAWEITETSSGEVLGKGERPVQMKDVQVIYEKKNDYLEQRIPLSDNFYLKLNAGRSDEENRGFGMAAGRTDKFTFCWEWFVLEEPGVAVKLQEAGKLGFDEEELGGKFEITRTKFLTDVNMRVIDWEDQGPVPDPKKSTWRVKILEGSEINWPTAAGGKVVTANKAMEYYEMNPPAPPAPSFWESLINVASDDQTTATR